FVSLLVAAAAMMLAPSGGGVIERRLGEVGNLPAALQNNEGGFERVTSALKTLGSKAPRSAMEMGKLQQRLTTAGYRNSEALPVFLGIGIGVALLMFLLFGSPIAIRPNFMLAIAACALGYVLPGMVLARKAKHRQHKIRLGLPDALDLLVVSVEAGLGLDQA